MLGEILVSYSKEYRKLHAQNGYCLVCNQYSECEISVLEQNLKILRITVRDYPEMYLFDWAECDHRVAILDKEDVKRYREHQVELGNYVIPLRGEMKISRINSPIRKFTFKHYVQLLAILLFSALLAISIIFILEKTGYSGPIF